MSPDHIHILPVGFDIHRLTAPLTSGEFDVDRVILLHSADDVLDEREGQQSQTDELVAHVAATVEEIVEDHVMVDVEYRRIPCLNDYRAMYARAYDLLWQFSEEDIVHINVSSLPLNAASAFINAAQVISSVSAHEDDEETLDDVEYKQRCDRIHAYYIRPDTYLAVQLNEYVQNELPSLVAPLEKHIKEDYPELEAEVLFGLSRLVRQQAQRLETQIKSAENVLQEAEPNERGDNWEDQIQTCFRVIDELQALGPDDPSPSLIRGEENGGSEGGYIQFFIGADRYLSDLKTALDRADDGALPADLSTDIETTLADLQSDLERYTEVLDWSDKIVALGEDLWDALQRADYLSERIERSGMTRGVQSFDGDNHFSLPMPPVYELRVMEQVILFALDRAEEPKAVGDLATEVAKMLAETLADHLPDSSDAKKFNPYLELQSQHLFEDENLSVDDLQTEFEDQLQSRIQYNLRSLAKKQYISRKPDRDDRRRTVAVLSPTGKLWLANHELNDLQQEIQDLYESIVDEHYIPEGTWRGRVAQVLSTEDWMDAGAVSEAVIDAEDIGYTLSVGGASSVLQDMYQHDDVVRRPASSAEHEYEYRLRENT